MKKAIISDSSSLIMLGKLGRIDLLANLFNQVIIPSRVAEEISAKEDEVAKLTLPHPLFIIEKSSNSTLLLLLDSILDYGEAEAIALAEEQQKLLLVDEKKARSIAKKRKVKFIGLLGLLIANKKNGYVSVQEVIEIKDQIKILGFRISSKLEDDFMKLLM